jgi:hypothetical protein
VSFPGLYDSSGSMDEYYEWSWGIGALLYRLITAVWNGLTIVSTVISVYAISQIFATNRALSKTNPAVKLNTKLMVLHLSLLLI